MIIRIGKLLITTEEMIAKKDSIDEKELEGEFSSRCDHSLRKNGAADVLTDALLALKKKRGVI